MIDGSLVTRRHLLRNVGLFPLFLASINLDKIAETLRIQRWMKVPPPIIPDLPPVSGWYNTRHISGTMEWGMSNLSSRFGGFQVGDLVKVGSEIVRINASKDGEYEIDRGMMGTEVDTEGLFDGFTDEYELQWMNAEIVGYDASPLPVSDWVLNMKRTDLPIFNMISRGYDDYEDQ